MVTIRTATSMTSWSAYLRNLPAVLRNCCRTGGVRHPSTDRAVLVGPNSGHVDMCKIITVLLSPGMLLLLILGTRPEGIEWTVGLAIVAYALAHVLFWPPILASLVRDKVLRNTASNPIGHWDGFVDGRRICGYMASRGSPYARPPSGPHICLARGRP